MSSEYISGSLETSGSAVVGGGLTVSGNTVLGGRVTVKGFLDAQNIKTPCKGLFKTEEELGEKYPDPLVGWWALVGSSEPLTLYRASGGEWENIGTDTFTIKIECDSLVSQIEAETSAREAADTALQANIDAEAKERKYQDDSLADGIEQTIDTLQSEMDERKAADESLRAELEAYSDNSVDNEAAERKAADTALSERVGALEASMTQSVA
ncbi:MAG: hypothetical protein LUC33_03115, partial [Prevotellaceae bacterium]|nr:hypothetical protein [Prevotellaceae bacterium]